MLCCYRCSIIFLLSLFLLALTLVEKRMGHIGDPKYGKARDELLAGKGPHIFYHSG